MEINPGQDIEPGKIETPRRMDSAQENPRLIEILKKHGGDPGSAAEELAQGLDDPENRIALARLIHEWDSLSKLPTLH